MDFNLSVQEQMLQTMAREFAVKKIQPRAAEVDRSGEFPFDLAGEMGKQGLQEIPYPVE